ncbi:hypothetical protein [Labedella endophytica]|uniref:Uncharacterized protein n=1 Tax=Labedella endophytica TaxID=1523160 RepID=A0A433JUA6_9MICO|nr:hypothetical protein [Labedella endophytica]RUR01768.1 hypothetical protein ELQ94_09940 [Labedella endophytica]
MAPTSSRTANRRASFCYAAQAVALAVVLIITTRTSALPVEANFRDGTRLLTSPIGTVDLGWALVAVLLGGAATHALAAVSATHPHAARPGVLVMAGWSQGLGIVVFLVAQSNGIVDAAALVPLFALSAGAVCLLAVDDGSATGWRRPAAWAAVIGIVPWGVIAFAQIGVTITLGSPPLGVRVVTLAALAVAALSWWIAWRRPRAARPTDTAIMTVAVSVLAWALVALSAPDA